MRKLFYFCKVVPILTALMCLGACAEDWNDASSDNPADTEAIKEARASFEDEIMKSATRSVLHDTAYYAQQMMLPLGEIVPNWNKGVVSKTKTLLSVDAAIDLNTYRYRVVQTDPETGKKRNVKCYHKLVIVKDSKTGKMGNYVVFYIATNKYSRAHRGIISEWFNNDGNMGDFSGLKIYTTLEGRIVRANKYADGKKVKGIYLGKVMHKKEYARGIAGVLQMMKGMIIQRGTKVTAITRSSEGDSDWSYGGDYDDLGGGFYYDDDNGTLLYDDDGDGDPDSIWTNGGGTTYDDPNDDDNSSNYPDPDPSPDQDDAITDDWWDDEEDNTGNNGSSDTPNIDKIYGSNSTLSVAEKQLLESVIKKMNENPIFKKVYDALIQKIKIDFNINNKIKGNAQYSTNKSISFANSSCIDVVPLREEMVHALQHNLFYQGNMLNPAYRFNIELEAHILVDAALTLQRGVFHNLESTTIGLSGTDDLEKAVRALMDSILKDGSFSDKQLPLYEEVGKQWSQYPGSYINSFTPETLYQYIKK